MNPQSWPLQTSYPRPQTEKLVRVITQEGLGFRGALIGKRREGKTDLLRQIYGALFDKAEGPIPFFYSFTAGQEPGTLARNFFAAFCQQVRGFVMRQEDLAGEPVSTLERELERAGLPLSLSELARNFLALAPAHQLEFAANLPAQFAHLDGRPLCLLLDDTHVLAPSSPFFHGLESPHLSWMLSGHRSFVSRMGGSHVWPLVHLESFSREDILALAEKACRMVGINFSQRAWEQWCDIAGTSAWLVASLIEAASVHEQALDSVEDLGLLYIQQLANGTIGQWLAERFEQAVPERRDRSAVAQLLTEWSKSAMGIASPPSLTAELADRLVAGEWAEETPAGLRIALEPVQREWLSIVAALPEGPSARVQSRAFQDFLFRVRSHGQQRAKDALLAAVRKKLLNLPRTGLPRVFESNWLEMYPPRVCSVASERSENAELFWCYGFRAARNEVSRASAVLLIIICEEVPSGAQVETWRRQLERESRLLRREEPAAAPAGGNRHELWLLLPPGAPLVAVRGERRFPWDTFARLMEPAGSMQKDAAPTRQS